MLLVDDELALVLACDELSLGGGPGGSPCGLPAPFGPSPAPVLRNEVRSLARSLAVTLDDDVLVEVPVASAADVAPALVLSELVLVVDASVDCRLTR